MSVRQLDKTYDPHAVEARWGPFWIEHGFFHARTDSPGSPYSIVIPPPNVTGSLHIGHAFNVTLQDILVRWRRMQGRNTLWLPGTDHAGIATQNVVERQLLAEGLSRERLGREAFIQRVWEWKHQYGQTIIDQLKKLGASCDWDREKFTMDPDLAETVREVFVRLYEEGLLYRGERLINWCPRCFTALSDIEVEHEQVSGKLYHIRYPLPESSLSPLIIATTRPETMLGDTAVAVHPEDPRYNHLIGKDLPLPLTHRRIPIIGDSILVDREFGTGAVKITPAHDFQDEEAGKRHGLSSLPIFDPHARLAPRLLQAAQVEEGIIAHIGLKPAQEARTLVVQILQERGLLERVEDHPMAIGQCYRCKTVVEPHLSPQWFVNIHPLAEPAIAAVESDSIRIIPEGWKNNYLGWMRQIKDWCVSRQIWWGHRIPAWYCRACNATSLPTLSEQHGTNQEDDRLTDPTLFSCLIGSQAIPLVSRVPPQTCPTCGGTDLFQDPDVLDTWFSSALWPFSTLGWPNPTPEYQTYYPTSTLVTGLDILFFWVSRMIMMGIKLTGQIPFRDVYIHALIRDAEGRKMSKSKGNVIDPLTKMREYGTDAMRFTLAAMASPGRDIKLAEERIEGYRNFVTKMWNAARFIHLHTAGPAQGGPVRERSIADRWILTRLNQTIREGTSALEEYRFDRAASILYQFLWHEYCDWYIELAKVPLLKEDAVHARMTRQTLLESFEVIQRILHPFMPFLTEELWQTLPHPPGETIVLQPYPQARPEWDDPMAEQTFSILEQFVNTTRMSRALLNYSPSRPLKFYGTVKDAEDRDKLAQVHGFLEHLARGSVRLIDPEEWPETPILRLAVGTMLVGIHLEEDLDLHKVLARVTKQVQDKQKEFARLEKRLASKDFVAKAEETVIQESQRRLHLLSEELSLLTSSESQLVTLLR